VLDRMGGGDSFCRVGLIRICVLYPRRSDSGRYSSSRSAQARSVAVTGDCHRVATAAVPTAPGRMDAAVFAPGELAA